MHTPSQPLVRTMSTTKLILVIGATGAQGLAVIDALLKPSADGSSSPYRVRALTRDPQGARAQELARQGVEVVQGMPKITTYECLVLC